MKTIRVGVLSFAHGHIHAYCNKIKSFDDAVLVACWDDNEARGREAAERYGMEFESSYEALVSRADIDAVIITSETNKHADLTVAAAEAGKHILCQKPMATTLEDCDRMIEAVESSGVHFQMAFQMRCDPLNQQIKKWIDEGAVGRVGSLRRRHCINFLFNPTIATGPTAWHIDPVANVGMFFDDAVHAADFLYWLLGKPVSVMAEIDNILTTVAPDDTGIALYRWESGAMGVLFNSSVTLAGENTCEIYGDEGVIIQNYDDGVSVGHAPENAVALKLFRKSTGKWEHFEFALPANHGERLAAIPRPFLDNLKAGNPPSITARDGRVSAQMCLAAYESAREGRRVSFPPNPRPAGGQ
ncbi:Gfo/Idh/MocA family oxidoreductase [Armatimonas sp.]|uniref:Gfo/Idh/MocA family protein n=1 Tax=Armatimonas sp. TaxID=1872638 RepID=UPI00286A67B1|nr:Gfo/Idh/MocA family oxidoreductase [Armatimonas sp.]